MTLVPGKSCPVRYSNGAPPHCRGMRVQSHNNHSSEGHEYSPHQPVRALKDCAPRAEILRNVSLCPMSCVFPHPYSQYLENTSRNERQKSVLSREVAREGRAMLKPTEQKCTSFEQLNPAPTPRRVSVKSLRDSEATMNPAKRSEQSSTTPDPAEREEQIRRRAYELYEARGREDGHELDDWLQAEAEILGREQKAIAA